MTRSRMLALVLGTSFVLAPASALADSGDVRQERGDIKIEWNGELDRAHGVRSGSGTMRDPYVISGWALNTITIRDTDKAIVIRDNTIRGRLTLNFVGPHVHVHHNDIGELRVNENIARWGAPMGGPIVENTIGVASQLRHFDGLFARNRVGVPAAGTTDDPYPASRALNLDGFNGARYVDNVVYGYVDARLHGHHHSSDFRSGGSHDHASADTEDHTKRFHRVRIARNTIHTSADYALAYLDTNHAANDRTATSETNPYLNAPHLHRTRAQVLGNELVGAGIVVNVFNARDDRHVRLGHGVLRIARNTVTLGWDAHRPFRELDGIHVRQARSVRLVVRGNEVTAPPPPLELEALRPLTVRGAGISLDTLDTAGVLIRNNYVENKRVGVMAARLTADVTWRIVRLRTSGVEQRVSYDGTVRNPPEQT